MDGLQWKPLLKWMIWGENPLFFGNTHMARKNAGKPHRKHTIEGLGWIPGWDVAVDVLKLLLMVQKSQTTTWDGYFTL